ncbi:MULTISPECIES: glycoside hydrolase family 13 protein [unclassified Leeuwenhoekiella]|uniref:glycoside hydrolase family 13 protein n=1 Tax=unclassified Leeuwenhoekiella TaxID=2615029 RepID=UPI000C5FB389|nr:MULTISPECIES: glycoside hydrolase family 13 protein [unclassified Leeuwenhoekiella]MAW94526.1 alpha-amlyase [Leeuwenhoekiella sp.]MBA81949.1 alpha-amlyase [Leeuwenhoekiella sp.]|tara:strand:+ start:6657 stop:8510 length:1854 start_codon:yes stop_codon:yes gene_type:complete
MKNFSLGILLVFSVMAQAQIERVEPPFWWEGLQRDSLQLLIYGKDIASYEVESAAGIPIIEVTKTENPNYLFVTLNSASVEAGDYEFSFHKEGSPQLKHPYSFKERREHSALRKGFDNSDLIYLLMPDRFANGNPAIDSHPKMVEKADRTKPGGRHGGDIQGIIDHLDYLKDLGATAIWSTPLCEDDDPAYSYHGYAQSDVYKIDPRYGSNEDYLKLSTELHKRDMKLIHDYVTNHWGLQHWIIQDLPTPDWIHQFEAFTNTNHRMTTQFDPYAAQIDQKIYEEGWFVPTMPDLNQSNPLVLNYLIQNAIWWVEYADLDGLRVDTYSYNHKQGIAQWTKALMDEYPNFNIVGEVWLHDSAQIAYWQKDSKIGALQDYNTHLPSVMDFTLHDALDKIFVEEEQWNQGVTRIYENFVNDFFYPNSNNLLVFAENHDTQRFNTRVKGSFDDYKLALSLICTTRGIPQVYYGSEIGMQGDKQKGDGDIRHDFPGGWPSDAKNAFLPQSEKNGRNAYQEQYFNFSKKLFNWRKANPVIHTGKLLQYVPQDNLYVYFRYNVEGDRVMVILNLSRKKQNLNLKRFSEGLAGHTQGLELFSGKSLALIDTLSVMPRTPMIINLNN